MFCHTKSPKSPHGLCLWRYYPIFMSARLFPTFLVPVYDESEVTDEETDEVKRRDPVDGSILDSLMTFFNRHMCWTWFLYIVNISACWLHRICQLRIDWLIDLRKRAREAKRWTLAVRSSPLSHVMCFCSPSAPRLPAAKRRTAGLRDSVCRRPTEIWRSSLKEVPLFSGLSVHAWIWPQTSFHMARGDGAVSGSWSRGSRMDGVLISVFGAFLMTLSALSLRTEIPPDSQTTEDDETFKDLRLHLIWGTLFSNL